MPDYSDKIRPLVSYFSQFIEVEEKEIEFLDNSVIPKSFKSKEIIYRQGEIQKYVGFITKGAVRFYFRDEKGEEYTNEFAFENVPIGEYMGLINEAKSPINIQALESTELLLLTKDAFLEFLNLYPRYYSVIPNIMGIALEEHAVRNKLLHINSSRERYEALCKLQPEILKRVPLTHIASYLKMALGTLSRIRSGKL